jgi:hypothetical protein
MRNIEKVSIKEIRLSPTNPRIIKDDKFHKLVRSIQEFPEMLEIRPIVVDEEGYVLGGNMRFKACKEAGLEEVFIIRANDLTEEQKKEFVIKDNSSFGDWDWEILQTEWDFDLLQDWGVDVFELPRDLDYSVLDDDDDDDDSGSKPSDKKPSRSICVPFEAEVYEKTMELFQKLLKKKVPYEESIYELFKKLNDGI